MAYLYAVYAGASYFVFLTSFLYAVGFVGDFFVPKSIDAPVGAGGVMAVALDVGLLALFALQHSVMARPAFKRWWIRFVPPVAERSTYVLCASLLLWLICLAWRPLPGELWNARGTGLGSLLLVGQLLGWLIVLVSTFMISHFELFGLTQAWRRLRNQATPQQSFTEAYLYRFVRHPLMLGFLIAFWATPVMTHGHLLFAVLTTGYILIGIQLEEHDMVELLGDTYIRYRARVPMLLPLGRRR